MINQCRTPVILASASPRRREILTYLGLDFTCIPPRIKETPCPQETPLVHVRRLAKEKGEYIAGLYPGAVIISADTIVVYDGQILGKPADKKDAFRILELLSGNTHEVITAFAITSKYCTPDILEHESTEVMFRDLHPEEIQSYINSGLPMDKAGAYGIQDLQAAFVRKINGCYFNVTGFPVSAFLQKWNATLPTSGKNR
ncbi:MAG: Maf family protein [Candidatus Marinimicrobia bacterium]|nr:Maf family protein [Candidatus Neomarinimicrobiota bacterium]